MSVIIDQLRISDNGHEMYIDVHVNKADVFDGVYLTKLYIKTAEQVSEATPELYTGDFIYEHTFGENEKEGHLVVTAVDEHLTYAKSDFSSDLFFVYIITTGTPNPCVPCTLDECTTVGVTFDENLLYQRVMGYTKELNVECSTPSREFIDFILLWNAFKASVETEHWVSAKKFYDRLFGKGNLPTPTKGGLYGYNRKGCGCHG